MANSKDDVHDGTGRRTYYPGHGTLRGWPGRLSADYTGSGVPSNGIQGFAPGATYQNFLGAAGTAFYVNVGTFLSATWVELTGGGGFVSQTIAANTDDAYYFTDGTTKLLSFDTRNTVTGVKALEITASPPTITGASGTTFSQVYINAATVTLTGTVTVTALDGIGAYIGIPTVTNASAGTVTTVSNLYVAAPAAAGGSETITNSYAIHSAGAVLIDTTLTVTGNSTLNGGTITLGAATTASIPAATAASLIVSDGVVNMISLDTRTTVTAGGGVTLTGEAPTLTSAGSAFSNPTLNLAAKTLTLTGTTTTTSWLGAALTVGVQTFTDSSSCTLTTASAIHINANAAAGGSLTITNSYMISTSVSGCFLTNAGVWTSTSTGMHKEEIEDAKAADVFGVLDEIKARSYKWKKDHVEDYGRKRYGLIAEELPEALRIPGTTEQTGMPDGIAAGFAIAACKKLRDENVELKTRLNRLEEAIASLGGKIN